MCGPIDPKGALVLQAQITKNLDKVIGFASRRGHVPGDPLSVFFNYSLVVCLELFGTHHLLLKNVKRLINNYVCNKSEDLHIARITVRVN